MRSWVEGREGLPRDGALGVEFVFVYEMQCTELLHLLSLTTANSYVATILPPTEHSNQQVVVLTGGMKHVPLLRSAGCWVCVEAPCCVVL